MRSAGLPAGPDIPDWVPPTTYLDRLEAAESRVAGFRSIYEFGTIVGSDATAMFDAAAASGEPGVYVPYRSGGWNVDSILNLNLAGAFWRGDRGGTVIYQQAIGRMLFDIAADDVTIEGMQLGYAPGEKATASWSYAEKDSATNALYNQDSTISRSAMIYNYGGSRVTVRDVDFLNTYGSIRMRSDDRYTTQAADNRVLGCRFRDFEFGLLMMNQINPLVSGLFGRDTGGLGGAPPHLIYCAGGGAPPSGVPVTGIAVTSVAATDIFTTATDHGYLPDQQVQFTSLTGGAGLATSTTYYVMDTPTLPPNQLKLSATLGGASIDHTTNVTAGTITNVLSDTVITGGLFANCVDYDNPYSSSFKLRNLRGTRVANMQSYNGARGLELAFSSGVVVDGVSATVRRAVNQDTEVDTTDSLGGGVMVSYSADCKVRAASVEMAAAEYSTGIRVESSADIEFFDPSVRGTFGAAGNPASFYKTVGSDDIWFYNPSWEHNGTDSPAVRLFSSNRVHFLSPRIDSAFRTDVVVIDSLCTDAEFVLDRDLMVPKLIAKSDMFNDSGANTLVSFRDKGVREQRVRTTNASATALTSDGKALSTDNVLWIPPNTIQRVTGQVVARDIATGDAAIWTVLFSVRRGAGTANPVFIGASTPTKETSDAGAATWTLVNNVDNTRDSINLFGTGEAAKTIDWRARLVMAGEV